MGQERTHAKFLSQGEGLAVVSFGLVDVRGSAMRSDLPEEPEDPCLVSPLLMGTGQVEGTPSEVHRLLHTASQQISFAHIAHPQRLTARGPQRSTALVRLLQQRQGLGDTTSKGIRTGQGRGGLGEPEPDVMNPAEFKAAFEHADGPGEVSLAEGETTDTEIRMDKAVWVIDRPGDPDHFFCMCAPLGERAQFGKTPG